jgi:hypothetical protein
MPINSKYQKKIMHDYESEIGKFTIEDVPQSFREKLFPF